MTVSAKFIIPVVGVVEVFIRVSSVVAIGDVVVLEAAKMAAIEDAAVIEVIVEEVREDIVVEAEVDSGAVVKMAEIKATSPEDTMRLQTHSSERYRAE